ncbi:MAG: restriction endonuclease subunit S [Thiomicrospira sp.]
MSDWQITTLGEIINTGNGLIQTGPFGSQLHASDYVSLGVPVIMPINLVDNRISLDDVAYITDDDANRLAKYILKAGDIVYSRRGDVTRKALITEKEEGMFCGTGCLLIRPGYKVESKFLAYFLSTPSSKEWIIRHAVGATMPNLNTSILSKVPLLLPDFSMQKRIAKILGDLDNKITLNRQINQTLESMAQAMFKSWFVDFEPVKAKMQALENGGTEDDANLAAMQAISGKTADQLATLKTQHLDQYQQLHHTASLFPTAMQTTELGEIPAGWQVKSLDAVAHYQNGLALQKFRPEDENDFLPVVKIAQLKKGFTDGEEKASPNINPSCIIDDGDVIFSWSGSLVVDIWCGGKAALNQHLFKVTSEDYPKWFYYYFTKHHLDEFQRIAQAKAVTMGHIKREHLKQALCAVPANDLIRNLGIRIQSQLDKAIASRLENRTLTELRDTLLPKLLSGELQISTKDAR